VIAVLWFGAAYPGGLGGGGADGLVTLSGTAVGIVSLYTIGLLLQVVVGVFIPMGTTRPEEEAGRLWAELDELQAALAATEADEEDLAARLETLRESNARFEIYEDQAGEYRWRLRRRNGDILADSGEGYGGRKRRPRCRRQRETPRSRRRDDRRVGTYPPQVIISENMIVKFIMHRRHGRGCDSNTGRRRREGGSREDDDQCQPVWGARGP
jgi:hypothetical protein